MNGESLESCLCLPKAIRAHKRQMMLPNGITIQPGWNDIHRVGGPATVWPLQTPDDIGGMIAMPVKREVVPASTYINDRSMDAYNVPGFYGVYLPYEGDWKVHYSGASAIRCVILDESNSALPMIRDVGCYAVPQHSTASVGVASGVAMAANPFRDYALFQNDSTALIYLFLGAAAVLNTGIRLNPSGGSYEMSRKLGNLWRGSVRAIATVAASNLLMLQGGIPVPT